MHLLVQSYETLELQQIRSELERRGIAVHMADEFTYAIPGMPGAEQPRSIWVATEDLLPAQRVVSDLLGPERVHWDDSSSPKTDTRQTSSQQGVTRRANQALLDKWLWLIAAVLGLAAAVVLIES